VYIILAQRCHSSEW